jgi:hypothetical protein
MDGDGKDDGLDAGEKGPAASMVDRPDSLERLLTYYSSIRGNATALVDPPDRGELEGWSEKADKERACLSYSFRQLDLAVERVSSHLMSLGLAHGDYVAMQMPNFTSAPILIIACMRAGLVPCMLPINWSVSQIDRALERLKPRILVSCGELEGQNHSYAMRELAFRHLGVRFVLGVGRNIADGVSDLTGLLAPDDGEDAGEGGGRQGELSTPARLEEPALVSFADETTPVPHSGGQILSAGLASVVQFELKSGVSMLCAYPFSSIPGLCGFLYPWLLSGGTICLHHPFSARTLLRQIRENEIGFMAAPEQLAKWLFSMPALKMPERIALGWGPAHMPGGRLDLPANVELFDMWNLGGLGLVGYRRDGEAPQNLFSEGHLCMPGANEGAGLCLAAGVIIDGRLHVRGRLFPSLDMLSRALEWFSLKKRVREEWLDTGLGAAPGPDNSIIITDAESELARAG